MTAGQHAPRLSGPRLALAGLFGLAVALAPLAASAACGDAATPIHAIQGSGGSSPLLGARLAIEGVVVGDYQLATELGGFFLQEEDADADADAATSEGIFIYDAGFGVDVPARNVVRVEGVVDEFFGLTEIASVSSVELCGLGATVTPAVISLPVADLSRWEQSEGMLVSLPDTLYATGNHEWARFGTLMLSAGDRLYAPTEVAAPGAGALAQADLNARSRILLDDGSRLEYPPWPLPYMSGDGTLRCGDTLAGLTGVLDYAFGSYAIHPSGSVAFARSGSRPTAPEPAPVGGSFRVASANLLNFFNGDGAGGGFPTARGADTASEFARQREKLVAALVALDADVIAVMELENDGYGPTSAARELAAALSAAGPAGSTWSAIDPGVSLGSDAIAVGLLYRLETARPVGAAATISAAPFDSLNRQPLAQTFEELATGERLTLIVNHFKSKSCSGAPAGEDRDSGDGQGCWNRRRTDAADAIAGWLDPTATGVERVLVIGDLNAYSREDPVAHLSAAGLIDVRAELEASPGYSYAFDSVFGSLDHAFASESLALLVTGVAAWHINADEPPALDYNEELNPPALYTPSAYRSSDHDPLLIGLDLARAPCLPTDLGVLTGLTCAKAGGTGVVCSWEPDAAAARYHLNSVGDKLGLLDPKRAPGGGAPECEATPPVASCVDGDALASATSLFYQALAACGASGLDEGPF